MQSASNYAASNWNTPKKTWFVKCARKIYTASEFYSHFSRCAQFAGAHFAKTRFAGAQFAAPTLSRGSICRGPIRPICHTRGPIGIIYIMILQIREPHWIHYPIGMGPICRDPICRKKITRGPICLGQFFGPFQEVHFWSIKGVYFFQNANNLNVTLFLGI